MVFRGKERLIKTIVRETSSIWSFNMGNKKNSHSMGLVAFFLTFVLMLHGAGLILTQSAVGTASEAMGQAAVSVDGWFRNDAGFQIRIDPARMCMADQWLQADHSLWGTMWSSDGLALSEDDGALYESAGRLVWSGRRRVLSDSEPLEVAGKLVWSG
jgi:hypothetical protein